MVEGSATDISQAERDAVGALLGSRLLARSPKILRFAEFIGRKYLEGEAEMLKEYNIAVEALGKPAQFDPKRDSIVRVEAHRLRRKLTEYYLTEGAADPLKMVIEPGCYVPRFVRNELFKLEPEDRVLLPPLPIALPAEAVLEMPAVAVAGRTKAQRKLAPKWKLLGVAVAVAVASLSATLLLRDSAPAAPVAEIRLLAGSEGGPLPGALGESWSADRWAIGGRTVFGPRAITLPGADAPPMNSQRQGNFDYQIPLAGGVYELRLYFAPRAAAAGGVNDAVSTRRFNVFANGHKILDALDPAAAHPLDGWITRVFRDITANRDGKLHLSFRSAQDTAYAGAIELTPGEKGRMVPIRIVARAAHYSPPNGRAWSADRYVSGGKLVLRKNLVKNGLDRNLYTGERFGTFTYEIPLASGRYGLRLYFAETWFGPGAGGGGAGSRRFDMHANGIPLLQDFDIFREAGGGDRAVIREFHGLVPNAEGYLNIAFVPRVNHACINALEVFDETR